MKKIAYGFIVAILTISFALYATLGADKSRAEEGPGVVSKSNPTIMAATPNVKMDKKTKITFLGTGFQPGEELNILLTTTDGVRSDIGYLLKPKPKANKIGAWVATWSCGRYISRKLVKEGAYSITVTDSAYNVLAHTPIAFYKAKAKKKKK